MGSASSRSPDYELALVMPVYNEQGCIGRVLTSWRGMLLACGINFVMLVLDDGSRDRTREILQEFARDDRIRILHQSNLGHGPTILRGYGLAVELAEWVFQCDSDAEMPPDSFRDLWDVRGQVDAVFGNRQNRRQALPRRIVSAFSRWTVGLLFGKGVTDVNTPYRLIRASVLRRILPYLPPDTCAPNVILSGALVLLHRGIRNVPVPCRPRQTGRVSLVRWTLWKAAFKSFRQIVRCRWKIRQANVSNEGVALRSGYGQE